MWKLSKTHLWLISLILLSGSCLRHTIAVSPQKAREQRINQAKQGFHITVLPTSLDIMRLPLISIEELTPHNLSKWNDNNYEFYELNLDGTVNVLVKLIEEMQSPVAKTSINARLHYFFFVDYRKVSRVQQNQILEECVRYYHEVHGDLPSPYFSCLLTTLDYLLWTQKKQDFLCSILSDSSKPLDIRGKTLGILWRLPKGIGVKPSPQVENITKLWLTSNVIDKKEYAISALTSTEWNDASLSLLCSQMENESILDFKLKIRNSINSIKMSKRR